LKPGFCKLGNLLTLKDWDDIDIRRDAAAVVGAKTDVLTFSVAKMAQS